MIMMSDYDTRADELAYLYCCAGGDGQCAAAEATAAALREAKRVLATTEPGFGSLDQDWPHRYTAHSSYYAALAESLAAAMADGGLLDRLAGGAR